MEKKLITAIILSVLVMVAFQFLIPKPPVFTPPQTTDVTKQPVPTANKAEIPLPVPTEKTTVEKTTVAETGKYILTFTNLGGSLKDVKLKEYLNPRTGEPMHLVKYAEGQNAIFALESNTLIDNLETRIFKLSRKEKHTITYIYSIPGKFTLTKEYSFYNYNDTIGLRVSIQNLGKDIIYKEYDLIGASGMISSGGTMGRRFVEIDSMIDGKLLRNGKVKNGQEIVKGIVSWTGVKTRYFCIVLKPQQDSEGVILRQVGKTELASGIRTKRIPIYPGAISRDSYVLYMGPNDATRLSAPGFKLEQIINYGIFGGISKILLGVLRIFHKIIRNWGVAIIMLTFLINIILFPLTRKSFLSMQKIQEVQPHIEKMRKLHKDNPQKLNKELAELYRQYKVNPLGGCLPLLIQMPIFIALYQGLMRSIELKGANFLWIKDLSRPDYVPLPFSLPLIGNEIHILPLLMVGAMFFQQKISAKTNVGASPEQQQQQKIMLIFFPLFFGFLFYNFPSGLVLYWLTNTVLMVIEHSAMRKKLQ